MSKENRPTFTITRPDGDAPRIQIGDDALVLDTADSARIRSVFERVADDNFPCIPDQTTGCIVPYDNGTIAMSLSAAKLTIGGSEFIIIVNYMFPDMDGYKTAMFYVNRQTLDSYITALAG